MQNNQPFDDTVGLIHAFKKILFFIPERTKNDTFDIRMQIGQPLMLSGKQGTLFVSDKGGVSRRIGQDTIICREEDIRQTFFELCGHSVFSHEEEIRQGFITAAGGYRVGICGTAVLESGGIKNIKDISSLVFRIPRQKQGCAQKLFGGAVDFSGGVLLIGEPSSGKTTLLRDICEAISYGTYGFSRRLAVLDERNEIAGHFNLGPCADILKGYPKEAGFTMALRCLSPQILVCDEISDREVDLLRQAFFCGVPVIATIHGSEKSLRGQKDLQRILLAGGFETLVFLKNRENPAEIHKIESVRDWLENIGCHADFTERLSDRAG